jgi:hypothetical protein
VRLPGQAAGGDKVGRFREGCSPASVVERRLLDGDPHQEGPPPELATELKSVLDAFAKTFA